MTDSQQTAVAAKYERVTEIVRTCKRPAVACSGGADSVFLLHAALRALGREQVSAWFVSSPLLPAREKKEALATIRSLGCRVEIVRADPLQWPEFTANTADRCYLCKKRLYSIITGRAGKLGYPELLDGTNRDDLADARPGLRALRELGVRTPLADAGLTKTEVRELSRQCGLPIWRRPSSSCLATRIPAGRRIDGDSLSLIARCEAFLHQRGYLGCRVRLFDRSAGLELGAGDVSRFAMDSERLAVYRFFTEQGFGKIFLDILERNDKV